MREGIRGRGKLNKAVECEGKGVAFIRLEVRQGSWGGKLLVRGREG